MYILLVSATYTEINTTFEWIKKHGGSIRGHEIDVLITGVGTAAASYAITRQLMQRTPELVVQAGIGGSFRDEYPPGSIVFVKEEVFADLGVYEQTRFEDVFDLGLAAADKKPFSDRLLINNNTAIWERFSLPFVRSATINCISSLDMQIRTIRSKYDPDVESMEGAALHYACIMEELPFIQLRAISNFVGERDKRNWLLKESVEVLNHHLMQILLTI